MGIIILRKLCAIPILFVIIMSCYAEENCETVASIKHISKEEFDDMGALVRTCSGEITVNKCEGMCKSQVQPSIASPTGFIKDCTCCKENYMRERWVTLNHCYEPGGARIEQDDLSVMEMLLREPDDCKCHKCGDFSR